MEWISCQRAFHQNNHLTYSSHTTSINILTIIVSRLHFNYIQNLDTYTTTYALCFINLIPLGCLSWCTYFFQWAWYYLEHIFFSSCTWFFQVSLMYLHFLMGLIQLEHFLWHTYLFFNGLDTTGMFSLMHYFFFLPMGLILLRVYFFLFNVLNFFQWAWCT